MTCIVGIKHEGKVWIGGDSAGVGGYQLQIREDLKVFRNGPMIFGFTSSFRMGQLLQYTLKIPKQTSGQTDFGYLCTTFMDAIMALFKEKAYATIKDSVELGGNFLIGYNGNLYEVQSDFQVGYTKDGYAACGCGYDLALGSLFTTAQFDWNPTNRLKHALSAAAHHSAAVAKPFKIIRGKY